MERDDGMMIVITLYSVLECKVAQEVVTHERGIPSALAKMAPYEVGDVIKITQD